MMDYREILRLRSLGFSQRQLEREKIVGREKSKEIYQAADRVGIHWPLDDDVTNEELELLLFPGKYSAASMYVEPDYPYIHRELAKHGVTLTLLWEEYCMAAHRVQCHLCGYGHGVRHSDYRISVKMPMEKALQKTDMDTCSSLSRITR